MRWLVASCVAMLLLGCAAQEETPGTDVEQAVRDYIKVRQLNELDKLRSNSSDHWTELDDKFIIYTSRNAAFLIEFARDCYELSETPVVADVRRERNTMRARFDTLRGCRLHKIYELTENDVAELEALGQPVGSGT